MRYSAKKLMGDSLQAIVMTKALTIVFAENTAFEYIHWHGFICSMGKGGSYVQ